jgi:hypothetical protein
MHFPVNLATSIAADNFFPDVAVNVILGGVIHLLNHIKFVVG